MWCLLEQLSKIYLHTADPAGRERMQMANIKFLLFDFETSDLYNKVLPPNHKDQAWPVQVGAMYLDADLNILKEFDEFVAPPSADAAITKSAFDTHGINLETCKEKGITYDAMRNIFKPIFIESIIPIGHNVWFDLQFVARYINKLIESSNLEYARRLSICTMRKTTAFCKLPPTESMLKYKGLKYKAPKLNELYEILFNEKLAGAHNALADCKATYSCLKELVRLGIIVL